MPGGGNGPVDGGGRGGKLGIATEGGAEEGGGPP